MEITDLILEDETLRLVPFRVGHVTESYINWLNDDAINSFLDVRLSHQTKKKAREYIRSFYGEEEKYMWGTWTLPHEELIGTVTLTNFNREHGNAEIGILIGSTSHWGGKTSMKALNLLCHAAFELLGLRRLGGGTVSLNQGANFLLKRFGFTFEGTRRQAWLYAPDKYADEFIWGLLREEWRSRRRNKK